MRHAMEPAGSDPVLEKHPRLTTRANDYTYTVETKGGQSTYSVTDGKETITLPIRWIFGQHTQTWVLEKDGHLYESLVSYFPAEDALGTTPGDSQLTPHTTMEAMGRRLNTWESPSCFDCHSTHALEDGKLALEKLTPGLDCERCHAGAERHMADAAQDNFKTLPRPLKRMDAESVSEFCGQCHRTWDTVVRNHWRGPAYVRFQPYRLANSKCFVGNDARISCLACHDPHQQLRHDAAFYDGKCLACHADGKAAAGGTVAKVCQVSKAKCASCHMPKVELPGGHAQFTDHQIRIVRPGDPYPD